MKFEESPMEQVSAATDRRSLIRSLAGIFGATAAGAALLHGREARAQSRSAPRAVDVYDVDSILSYSGGVRVDGELARLIPTRRGCGEALAVAAGSVTAGDGGGGVFVWDDTKGASGDDGGTIIVPPGQREGRWQRIFSGAYSVRWFGAVGDGATFDDGAIAAAIQAAGMDQRAPSSQVSPPASGPTVYFPAGTYLIDSSLTVGNSICLLADYAATIVGSGYGFPLIRLAGRFNRIDGLGFFKGSNHIAFDWVATTSSGAASCRITNCIFRYCQGPAIYIDPTTSGSNSILPMSLTVANFDFAGSCLFWGSCDSAQFSGGRVSYDLSSGIGQPPIVLDGGGLPLACWNSGGALSIEEVDAGPNNPGLRACYVQGGNTLRLANVRLHGNGAVAVRLRSAFGNFTYSPNWPGATAYGLPGAAGPASLILSDCLLASSGNATTPPLEYWLEIYDRFPTLLSVSNPVPSTDGSGEYAPLWGSMGAWVEASVPLPVDSIQTFIELEGAVTGAYTFSRSNDPPLASQGSNAGALNIDAELRRFFKRTQSSAPLGPQVNLFTGLGFAGVTNVVQLSGSASLGVTVGTPEDSTGFGLRPIVASEAGAYWGAGTPQTWGGTGAQAQLPPGEYVFSMVVKANYSGLIRIYVDGLTAAILPCENSNSFGRVHCPFYHDGATNHSFAIAFYGLPPGGSVTPGLFAIHRGNLPAPYTFPVNSYPSPTTNVTLEDIAVGTYRAPSFPIAGSYNQGDIVYNSAPTPGNPIGWVCTASGSPGTWRSFGDISL